jgi:integrase
MARKKKSIVWPHLNDCKGDVASKWYVEYSVTNPVTGEKVRTRVYEGFESKNRAKRYEYARKLIEELNCKLTEGWRPFDTCEAKQYVDELKYHGDAKIRGRDTVSKSYILPLLSEFLAWKRPTIKHTSFLDYQSALRQFSLYIESKKLTDKELSFFTKDVIIEFLRFKSEDQKLSRKRLSKYVQLLTDFFEFVRKQKKIDISNPLSEDVPRFGQIVDYSPAGIPDYLRRKLKEKIETADPQLWMACCFIYYTAIRPGTELRLMQFNQINFQSRIITVRNDLAKNSRTETIDIPDALYYMIKEVWKLDNYPPDMYLFSQNGKPGYHVLGKNTMRQRFNQIRDSLKLHKSIKFYSWKHSGAQELADNGISIYELQRHLRHRDITTTEIYLKKRIGQRSSTIKHNFPEI